MMSDLVNLAKTKERSLEVIGLVISSIERLEEYIKYEGDQDVAEDLVKTVEDMTNCMDSFKQLIALTVKESEENDELTIEGKPSQNGIQL